MSKLNEHWSTALCPDHELEVIKEVVLETTKILKKSNDEHSTVGMPWDNCERKRFWKVTSW